MKIVSNATTSIIIVFPGIALKQLVDGVRHGSQGFGQVRLHSPWSHSSLRTASIIVADLMIVACPIRHIIALFLWSDKGAVSQKRILS